MKNKIIALKNIVFFAEDFVNARIEADYKLADIYSNYKYCPYIIIRIKRKKTGDQSYNEEEYEVFYKSLDEAQEDLKILNEQMQDYNLLKLKNAVFFAEDFTKATIYKSRTDSTSLLFKIKYHCQNIYTKYRLKPYPGSFIVFYKSLDEAQEDLKILNEQMQDYNIEAEKKLEAEKLEAEKLEKLKFFKLCKYMSMIITAIIAAIITFFILYK
jgi:hypothetical protein